jgi:hypothetical protein
MFLYFTKNSRTYFANVVCELSKCMDGSNVAAYKVMIRAIRFVLYARDTCLKLKPNLDDENWDCWPIVIVIGPEMLIILSV